MLGLSRLTALTLVTVCVLMGTAPGQTQCTAPTPAILPAVPVPAVKRTNALAVSTPGRRSKARKLPLENVSATLRIGAKGRMSVGCVSRGVMTKAVFPVPSVTNVKNALRIRKGKTATVPLGKSKCSIEGFV